MVLADRYMMLMRAILFTTVTSTNVATVFVDKSFISYSMLTYLLTDNGPRFVSDPFGAVTTHLEIKHLTTIAHHPQTNGQVEEFNRTIVACLPNYVAEHQTD